MSTYSPITNYKTVTVDILSGNPTTRTIYTATRRSIVHVIPRRIEGFSPNPDYINSLSGIYIRRDVVTGSSEGFLWLFARVNSDIFSTGILCSPTIIEQGEEVKMNINNGNGPVEFDLVILELN